MPKALTTKAGALCVAPLSPRQQGEIAMLDHGMLNLPLAKRGCIDAQIDAYKAQKARNAKAEAKALHEARQRARAAVVAMSDERCIAFSNGQMTAKQARAKLLSIARFTPASILNVVGGAA